MLTHEIHLNDMDKLKTMYTWLLNGYKAMELRLAEVVDENIKLKQQVRNKNVHPFID